MTNLDEEDLNELHLNDEIDLKDDKIKMKIIDDNNGKASVLSNLMNAITKWFSVRFNLYIFAGIVTIVLLLVIILVVVLTVGTKKESDDLKVITAKINCLPWLNVTSEIEYECTKNLLCIFDVNSLENSPLCFFDPNAQKLILINEIETELGITYMFKDEKSESGFLIRVDFEFLDDYALRFKVS